MNILIIAYLFPPDSSSGSFRPLHFARHLQANGEHIFVLTAREEDFMPYQTRDPKLLKYLDAPLEIFRARVFRPGEAAIKLRNRLFRKSPQQANPVRHLDSHDFAAPADISRFQRLKDTLTDFLSTPDAEIGWVPAAVRAGKRIVTTKHIDVIYVTGAPWTSLIVAAILKKMTGKPVVMDFRDPWVSNPIFTLKSTLSQKIETFLERKVLACADHIVTNTAELKQDFLRRFPWLPDARLTPITNGFEAYFDTPPTDAKQFTLTHAGTLIFRNPRFLLQAALNLIEKKVIPAEELRLNFLGGITTADAALQTILAHPRLQQVVAILPRLPYHEANEFQSRSEVLFLMQPEEFALQVPRKLYEYIAFRRPIFGITPLASATGKIIRENQLGVVAANETPAIEAALQELYAKWKMRDLSLIPTRQGDKFMNKNLTAELQTVFRKACGIQ